MKENYDSNKKSAFTDLWEMQHSDLTKVSMVANKDSKQLAVKKQLLKGDNLYKIFETLSNINNPNLPQILSLTFENDNVTVLESYVHGVTLSEMLQGGKRFTERETICIALQICNALKDLHSNNIVHRDIKPSNIMMINDSQYVLIDFNAARFYGAECKNDTCNLGTKGYAPPEQ